MRKERKETKIENHTIGNAITEKEDQNHQSIQGTKYSNRGCPEMQLKVIDQLGPRNQRDLDTDQTPETEDKRNIKEFGIPDDCFNPIKKSCLSDI